MLRPQEGCATTIIAIIHRDFDTYWLELYRFESAEQVYDIQLHHYMIL